MYSALSILTETGRVGESDILVVKLGDIACATLKEDWMSEISTVVVHRDYNRSWPDTYLDVATLALFCNSLPNVYRIVGMIYRFDAVFAHVTEVHMTDEGPLCPSMFPRLEYFHSSVICDAVPLPPRLAVRALRWAAASASALAGVRELTLTDHVISAEPAYPPGLLTLHCAYCPTWSALPPLECLGVNVDTIDDLDALFDFLNTNRVPRFKLSGSARAGVVPRLVRWILQADYITDLDCLLDGDGVAELVLDAVATSPMRLARFVLKDDVCSSDETFEAWMRMTDAHRATLRVLTLPIAQLFRWAREEVERRAAVADQEAAAAIAAAAKEEAAAAEEEEEAAEEEEESSSSSSDDDQTDAAARCFVQRFRGDTAASAPRQCRAHARMLELALTGIVIHPQPMVMPDYAHFLCREMPSILTIEFISRLTPTAAEPFQATVTTILERNMRDRFDCCLK